MELRDAYAVMMAESPLWCMEEGHIQAVAIRLAAGLASPRRASVAPSSGRTAVIGIMGPLSRRPGLIQELFGLGDAGSYEGIRRRLFEAAAQRDVDRIVLIVDSPGGAALGVEELAEDIRQVGRTKPVTAVVDVLCASAALWLGSAAGALYATPSGEIGSVGVVQLHLDISRALDTAGATPTFIVSRVSPFKTEGTAFLPLGDEAHAYFQGEIDELAGRFVRDLARGRRVSIGTVKRDFGGGRTMFSPEALRVGLIDGIERVEAVIAGNAGSAAPRRATKKAAGRRLSETNEQKRARLNRRLALERKI